MRQSTQRPSVLYWRLSDFKLDIMIPDMSEKLCSDLTPLVSNSNKSSISVSNEFDLISPPIFLYSIIINTTHLHFLWKEFNDLWLTRLAAELGHTCNNRRVEWPIERIYERRRFEAHHSQAVTVGHTIDCWGYYFKYWFVKMNATSDQFSCFLVLWIWEVNGSYIWNDKTCNKWRVEIERIPYSREH